MRVVMFGDRHWKNRPPIFKVVKELKKKHGDELFIFSGGAPGADTIIEDCCKVLGIAFARFPAWWNYYDNGAGPKRNGWMLKFGLPDQGIGFHPNLKTSKGTKDMKKRLEAAGVPVVVYKRV